MNIFEMQKCPHCGCFLAWSTAFNMPLCPNENCFGKSVCNYSLDTCEAQKSSSEQKKTEKTDRNGVAGCA